MASDRNAAQYERLVGSFTTHLFALVSVSIAYVLLAINFQSRVEAIGQLHGLDKLLAIREVLVPAKSGQPFTKRNLPEYFARAAEEASAPTSDGTDPYYTHILDSRGFTEEEISQGSILQVSSRLVQRNCDVARFKLSSGKTLEYATFQIVGKIYHSESSDAVFGVLDQCFDGDRNFVVLKSGSDYVLALPKSFERDFAPLAPPPPFKSFPFAEQDKITASLPKELASYINLPADMVTIHIRAVENYILAHATRRHGKYYAPAEIEQAVNALYDEREAQTVLFGISAKPSLLVGLGPLLIFIISFEMWRRVRRIPFGSGNAVFWFATDTGDNLGRATAYVYSFLPLACVAACYLNYAAAIHPTFVGMDDIRRALNILQLDGVSVGDVLNWIPVSVAATLIMLLVPFQIALTFVTIRRLVQIATTSGQKLRTRPRPSKMTAIRLAALKRRWKR